MNSNIKIIGLGGMGANVIASRYPAKNIRGVHRHILKICRFSRTNQKSAH